jgi:NhaP-type Na+/H+ or K+/H+ antiporter
LNTYVVTLFIFGAVVLLTAWLPMALRRLPLSLPMCCIAIGAALGVSPLTPLPAMNPLENIAWAEHLTEFVVIVALMGAGLKIDRPLDFRNWAATWRLLGIAMPLSIASIALIGWSVLGLGAASALLLGSALAPTDPVLAADVQVGPPQTGEEDTIRFALTAEAGLNDGLSFPFVLAAIAIANEAGNGWEWVGHWFLFDVVWKLVDGI